MKRRFMLSLMGMFAALIVLTTDGFSQTQRFYFHKPANVGRLIESGQFDDALRELNDFRRREPANPWGLYYLAQIEEDYRQALWLYNESARLAGPDSVFASDALYLRAEIIYAQGELDDAAEAYQSIVDSYHGTVAAQSALNRLGNIALAQGEPDRAKERFNACLASNPDGERFLYAQAGLMEAACAREKWQDALNAAMDVLAAEDDMSAMTPRVLEVMALAWQHLGNEENAERYIDRLLSTYPYSYQAHAIRERFADPLGDSVYSADPNSVSGSGNGAAVSGESLSRLVPAASARFTLQAGAFSDRDNALSLLRTLQEARFDARVESRTVQERHFYVIRVGYFATREAAETIAARIEDAIDAKPNVMVLE